MKALQAAAAIIALGLLIRPARADGARPTTFLRQLGAPNLDNPKYLKEIREYAPDVLMLGRAVPLDSAMGPISQLGGGDSRARDVKDIILLKPKELEERVKFLRRLNVVLHESGVKSVLPYTSAISLIGTPGKPTGFFAFYRHWRDYPGLGQRPSPSPEEWFAMDKFDHPLPVSDTIDPDYLRPMKRYAACAANPAWREWMQQVTRSCIDSGYDGVYVDHCIIIPCHCQHCSTRFHAYLSKKYGPAEFKKHFGKGIEKIRLSEEKETFAGVETMLFRQLMLKELLAAMREACGKKRVQLALKGIDLWKLEQFADVGDYFCFDAAGRGRAFNIPGVQETQIIDGICQRQSENNIIPLKCAAAIMQRPKLAINIHTRDAITRELGFAETLAFASPPFFGGAKMFSDPATQRKYRGFLSSHADLFGDASPYANVGVIFFGRQKCYPGGGRHVAQAQFVMGRLATHRVPFEVITAGVCNPNTLSRYRAVIVPALLYADEARVLAFQEYVKQGGTLVVSKDSFRFDERCIRREKTWIDRTINRPKDRQEDILHVPLGKGWIVHTPRDFDDEALAQGIRQGIETGPLQVIYRGAWHVRVNVRMRRTDLSGDLLVHFVNYNICPSRGPKAIIPAKDVLCFLRTPKHWGVFSVTAYSPDDPVARQIEFSHDKKNRVLRFALPEVKIYTIVRISCRAAE
ncbi:MAG: hypothetical protein GXP25_12740 [Planctomycetes bacterium]|nr:hypothetical protein [Planctomycetota bacterium]